MLGMLFNDHLILEGLSCLFDKMLSQILGINYAS